MMLKFVVPGPPVPKGRPRFGNGRAFTPKKTRDYEEHVRSQAAFAMGGCGPLRKPRWLKTDQPVAMMLRIFWPDARRRDIDNNIKCILDSANGLVFDDDSQVSELHVSSAIDRSNPRVEVEVHLVEVAPVFQLVYSNR
jgi:Holliday junction resolvase RusA-like endonuclease